MAMKCGACESICDDYNSALCKKCLLEQIRTEKDEFIKRTHIYAYGWLRWLTDTGASIVDKRIMSGNRLALYLLQVGPFVDCTKAVVFAPSTTGDVECFGVNKHSKNLHEALLILFKTHREQKCLDINAYEKQYGRVTDIPTAFSPTSFFKFEPVEQKHDTD